MADALASGASVRKDVGVQVPPRAPKLPSAFSCWAHSSSPDVRKLKIMQKAMQKKPLQILKSDLLISNVILSAIVFGLLVIVLRLWHWSPSVPLSMGGDNSFYLSIIRNLSRGHSLYVNHSLGAPTGQTLYDFPPVGELLNYGYLQAIALVTKNIGLTETLFYFSTFFFAAIAANVTARRLGIGRNPSIVISIFFAFLPYHFIKNVQHLMLSNYFVLPLILFAALEIIQPRAELRRRRRILLLLVLGALAGGTGIYYAIFSFVLLCVVVLLSIVNSKTWKSQLKRCALYFIGMFSIIVISAVPVFLYGMKNGFYKFQRSFSDVEYYGLKIANLFRPIVDHRVGFFRSISAHFGPSFIPGEPVEMLGIIGAICLAGLLVFAANSIFTTSKKSDRDVHLSVVAVVAVVAILFSTVDSFNTIFFVLGLNQIRVWARIAPLIAFCAFAFGAIFFERWWQKRSVRNPFAYAGLCAVVLAIGIYDQTSTTYVPQYQINSMLWSREEAFTRAADEAFPVGSMVYQLPVVMFPENGPTVNMEDYAQSFPFIHGSQLRWSYGHMKTRPSPFHEKAATLNGSELLNFLKSSDFVGLQITRRGFEDRGEKVIADAVSHGAKILYQSSDQEEVLLDIRNVKKK